MKFINEVLLILISVLGCTQSDKIPVVADNWVKPLSDKVSISKEVEEFLSSNEGNMRLSLVKYSGSKLLSNHNFVSNEIRSENYSIENNICVKKSSTESDLLDLTVQFIVKSGKIDSSGFAVSFDFSNWDTTNYLLLPASVYNANRCKIVNRGYAQGLDRKYLYQKKTPWGGITISDFFFIELIP
jgi:hypothetical protein